MIGKAISASLTVYGEEDRLSKFYPIMTRQVILLMIYHLDQLPLHAI